MSATVLDRAHAFSHGSELWIVASHRDSLWTSKIDWYLNYSLLRGANHTAPKMAADLVSILESCQLDFPQVSPDGEPPVMVDSSRRLPNRWTVCIGPTHRIESWINKSHHVWKQLNHPSLRLFPAKDHSVERIQTHWQQLSERCLVTIVPHEE